MFVSMRDQFLKSLGHIEEGTLNLSLPDGSTHQFSGSRKGVTASFDILEWSVLTNLMRAGDTGFAQDYALGRWRTDNLQNLVALALQNEEAVKGYLFGNIVMKLCFNILYWFRSNSLYGSRRNIQTHYDLGNDFYQLWLDPSMTYSSALYKNQGDDLAEAQRNKYDRILDRLGSSGRTLEVGCGWGGFADRALQKGDYNIKAITLSDQQHAYAKSRLRGAAHVALEDYRHQIGAYDHIVSIEMFEAVGEKYWKTYFEKLAYLLKSSGKALIQTITIDDNLFESYRSGQDFIRSHIFPGGMLPSAQKFKQHAEAAGLRVNEGVNFGLDYARTLETWLQTFDAQYEAVRKLGYDDKFIRMWRFYLAACAAAFQVKRTDVYQFELQHA
jgi:cyclopropane-fatty-acyl-phospholipid synthase